jgi:thiol:disulfide interchange protein
MRRSRVGAPAREWDRRMNTYCKRKRVNNFLPLLSLLALTALPLATHADDLNALLKGGSQNGFLSPDQAFTLTVVPRNPHQLVASFTPAPGYYLYRDRIRFSLQNSGKAQIAHVNFPPAEIKSDPYFGKMAVYHHPFQVAIELKGAIASNRIQLAATYQGCSDRGLCYPPATKNIVLKLAPQKANRAVHTALK